MSDSFSELRAAGGPNKPWVAGGVVVLLLAVTAAIAAAVFALSRPAPESPQPPTVVTVTAQPRPEPSAGSPSSSSPSAGASGTYTGTLSSESASWEAMLTLAGDTAMIVYPHSSCTALLTRSDESNFVPEFMTKQCRGNGGKWTITETESGVIQLRYDANGHTHTKGVLSLITP